MASSSRYDNHDGAAPHEQEPFASVDLNSGHRDYSGEHEDGGNTLYDRGDYDSREKYSPPSLDTFNTLQQQDSAGIELLTMSPTGQRADASRLTDDLELLRAERFISNQEHEEMATRSRSKNRAHNPEPEDAFNPTVEDEGPAVKKKNENAALYKLWKFLKKFPRIVRYVFYLVPGAALLLIPVLIGGLRFHREEKLVGGVELMWFGIWLEIVWCSLWLSRMATSLIPHIFHGVAKVLGSTSPKKWRDVGWRLELHAALFLWFLAILISFKPTTAGHRHGAPDKGSDGNDWIDILNKIIIALFVLFTLNIVEKILIQWIATSFHQRTYSTRIENNKGDIRQLTQLFEFAKGRLEDTDQFWMDHNGGSAMRSGAQTPMANFQENARRAFGKVGYVANKVGNDLIGRKVNTNVPRRVVTELLRSTSSAHTLARLIYRSVVREGRDTVHPDDMERVFNTKEEIDAAFGVFDKDLNGDISIDEFQAVCNEIHLEKKAIAASLKDLDSVIQKLDKVFLFIIIIISIIVFISIFSSSTAAGLASASTSVLGLAWVLQATAQEFLQSIIFVFIKHPFDVGDRVTIYGSTGDKMTGDDYYVTEISLLYTEFKKMQGHIVQAPNSILNTLFILNQRRSNGLSDVLPLKLKFGTPGWMIDELKARMLEFCLANKRDYQPTIITELTAIEEVRSCNLNFIFIHKSNFQNELLRLNRHNKFVTELMAQMVDIGIQAPLRMDPGGSREYPMYWAGSAQPPPYASSSGKEQQHDNDAHAPPRAGVPRHSVSVRSNRPRATSAANDEVLANFQDVYENRRDQSLARRMQSIREKEVAERAEAESEPRASTTSASLQPMRSQDSQQRSRFFGRNRAGTRTQHHPPLPSQREGDIV